MRCSQLCAAFALVCTVSLHGQTGLDAGYSNKIREYTTSPQFLTELVDHLPASAAVPSPEKFLGYAVGTPEKLTYAKDIHRYMRELAKATPRVRVETMGQTEEGREMVLVLVSDEVNLKRLNRYKEITARLSDPRETKDAEAEKLIAEGLPIYWATGSIHSTETGSPEMLMELVYRLAVSDTPIVRNIRKNLVVMITPVIEVDGRERMVDLYRWRKSNPKSAAPNLLYWGKYVAHDNNRDGMALSLALSRNVTKKFLEYHPQVFHDLHESIPFLYTSTGMGPYNAWLDPIVINEWQKLAWHEVEEMTKRGVPGVWTHGFYDGWAANYMFTVANGHNAIGRFYESFGNGGADTRDRTVPAASAARAWYRPNPPLEKVKWSIRNNINLQQSALMLALNYTAENKSTFLRNFWLKGKRSVDKPKMEGPAAYVISREQRPNEAASLVALLLKHGVEVHSLSQETEVSGLKFPARSLVVRMDQPFSRMADMLLDRQYYSATDTPPYDDTGWTMSALRNLKSTRVTETSLLSAPMEKLDAPPVPEGLVEGRGSVYLLDHNADRVMATVRFKLAGLKLHAAEAGFEAAGRKFRAGTLIVEGAGLRERLQGVAAEFGVTFHAVEQAPEVAKHVLATPRIALAHSWLNTQAVGWFRLAMDNTGIPYAYVSDHLLRATPNLREKFDVIVFGPTPGSSQRVVNGLPFRGQAVPWNASLGENIASSPDLADDIRGGMGLEGLTNVRKFVGDGGLFITIGGNSSIPIDYGLVDGVAVAPARELRARGSVYHAVVADARSPIVYGYDDSVPVYFNAGPILNVLPAGGLTQGSGGGAQLAARPSGRGGPQDPDVPQGRPYVVAPAPEPPGRLSPEMMESMRNYLPRPEEEPRVVLKFAEEKDLLVSGMLSGGGELAGKPAIVDIPLGKGHFLLFAINPMWREQTQGSFMLLLNAAMHFDYLGVGRPAKRAAEAYADFE